MIEHNGLLDEMDAAARFGWRDYWESSRPERALMTGDVRAKQAIQAMIQYEASEKK